MDRLVDGYGKNLIPDDRMRPRMEALKDEQGRLLHRVAELEGELARLQGQAALIEGVTVFAAKVSTGLDALDTDGQQKLLRLLVREVRVIKDVAVVRTVLPTGQGGDGQLCTPDRDVVLDPPTQDDSAWRFPQRWLPPERRSPVHRRVERPQEALRLGEDLRRDSRQGHTESYFCRAALAIVFSFARCRALAQRQPAGRKLSTPLGHIGPGNY
jgi:hypothetical protein